MFLWLCPLQADRAQRVEWKEDLSLCTRANAGSQRRLCYKMQLTWDWPWGPALRCSVWPCQPARHLPAGTAQGKSELSLAPQCAQPPLLGQKPHGEGWGGGIVAMPEGRGTTGCTEHVASAALWGTSRAAGHRDGFARCSSSWLPSHPGRAPSTTIGAPLGSLPAGACTSGHCFSSLLPPLPSLFLLPP